MTGRLYPKLSMVWNIRTKITFIGLRGVKLIVNTCLDEKRVTSYPECPLLMNGKNQTNEIVSLTIPVAKYQRIIVIGRAII